MLVLPVVFFVYMVAIKCLCANGQACLNQVKYVQPDLVSQGNQFGYAVAISGSIMIAGANNDDDIANQAGSVTVYNETSPGVYTDTFKILAGDGSLTDRFGTSLAISGTTIVVGQVNIDTSSAYVFSYTASPGVWTQVRKLSDSVGAGADDEFGLSVAVSSTNLIVVGARSDADNGVGSGAAYVFKELSSNVWSNGVKLVANDPAAGDVFGNAVAVSDDDIIFVSSPNDDDSASGSGSVYVFLEVSPDVFSITGKIEGDDLGVGDAFGKSIAVASSHKFVAGAFGQTSWTGAAYVFTEQSVGIFTQTQKLVASDPNVSDYFGYACDIDSSGSIIVIGSHRHDGPSGSDSGSAHVFVEQSSGFWMHAGKIVADDAAGNAQFGWAVAASENSVAIGAYYANSGGLTTSGALYVFTDICGTDVDECLSSPCFSEGVCISGALGTYESTFTCDCSGTGFEGDLCQSDVDDCTSSPCENFGVCFDAGTNAFTCDCTGTGFQGDTCATDVDDCSSSPCLNDGICTDAGANTFTCDCTGTGFQGDLCATDVDDCSSSPCLNDGICADAGANAFSCDCMGTGFRGDLCSSDLDDCASLPCVNGACSDAGANAFTCDCTGTGFQGDMCATDVDDCISSPCQNSAVCSDAGANAFTCDCSNTGFTDVLCSIDIDDCMSSPCLNAGSCTDDGRNAFRCSCVAGFEGMACETNVDDCSSSPCFNGATCVDHVTNVTCVCSVGYEGELCAVDTDDCLSMPCADGTTCIDAFASYTCAKPVDPCMSAPCSDAYVCRALTDTFSCIQTVTAVYEGLVTCPDGEVDCSNAIAVEAYFIEVLSQDIGGTAEDYDVTVILYEDGTYDVVIVFADVEDRFSDGSSDDANQKFVNAIDDTGNAAFVIHAGVETSTMDNSATGARPHGLWLMLLVTAQLSCIAL